MRVAAVQSHHDSQPLGRDGRQRYPPNPAELIGSHRVRRTALPTSRSHCDIVVIDTPPVMAVADAAILAHQTSGVLFVVAADTTSRHAAQSALEQLERAKGRFLGAVLNRVDARQSDTYRYASYSRAYRAKAKAAQTCPALIPLHPGPVGPIESRRPCHTTLNSIVIRQPPRRLRWLLNCQPVTSGSGSTNAPFAAGSNPSGRSSDRSACSPATPSPVSPASTPRSRPGRWCRTADCGRCPTRSRCWRWSSACSRWRCVMVGAYRAAGRARSS